MTTQIIGRVACDKDWQGNDNTSNKNKENRTGRMKCIADFPKVTLAECLNRWM